MIWIISDHLIANRIGVQVHAKSAFSGAGTDLSREERARIVRVLQLDLDNVAHTRLAGMVRACVRVYVCACASTFDIDANATPMSSDQRATKRTKSNTPTLTDAYHKQFSPQTRVYATRCPNTPQWSGGCGGRHMKRQTGSCVAKTGRQAAVAAAAVAAVAAVTAGVARLACLDSLVRSALRAAAGGITAVVAMAPAAPAAPCTTVVLHPVEAECRSGYFLTTRSERASRYVYYLNVR